MKSLLIMSFFLFTQLSFAQQKMIFDHPEDLKWAQLAVEQVYNYQFAAADVYIERLKEDYEKHPVYNTLKSLAMYQQSVFDLEKDKNDPVYHAKLKSALEYADLLYKSHKDSDEAIFFELLVHSYLALYHNENKNFMNAAGEGKRAYKYLKKGYDRKETNPEFYLTSGLLDFYSVQYPEANPLVKPVMWFFPNGDKERGVEYLYKGSEQAVFTRPECYSYIIHIYLKYQNEYDKAVKIGEEIIGLYTGNLFFKARYAEALIYNGAYKKAKIEINKLLESDIEFFKFVGYTLNGVYYEKYLSNREIAKNNFKKAVSIGEKNVKVSFDYLSIAYTGMARYYDYKGKDDEAEDYYEKALDIAEYKSVIKEAEDYEDAH